MKTLQKLLCVVSLVLLTFSSYAQNQTEDVVYLKNGSIYRGAIIEQIPNESLKVQIMGGSIIAVQMVNVDKITKEAPFSAQPTINAVQPEKPQQVERVKTPFEPRKKGYFFQGHVLMELMQGGIRVVNGYKFGQFAHLGIGVGFDALGATPLNQAVNGLYASDLAGVYLPIYLYYAGDILSSRVTPFYAIEAGYTHPLTANNGPFDNTNDIGFGGSSTTQIDNGGAMATAGIGVRFNTKRRINLSLLLNVGIKNVQYSEMYYLYDEVDGIYESYGTTGLNATLITGGLRFGIGF